MTARKLSRRVALRGGAAAAAMTAGVAVGGARVAAKADPLLAMNRERLRLRDERHRIEDWCEDMATKAPESGTMEYRGVGGRPIEPHPGLFTKTLIEVGVKSPRALTLTTPSDL